MTHSTKIVPDSPTSRAVTRLQLLESIKELVSSKIALHDCETNPATRQIWKSTMSRVQKAERALQTAIDNLNV